MNKSSRLEHIQVFTELQKKTTLLSGFSAFVGEQKNSTTLFLGLGAKPEELPELFPRALKYFYIECPETERQMSEDFLKKIPQHFTKISADSLDNILAPDTDIINFKQNIQIAGSFWNPINNRIFKKKNTLEKKQEIWILTNKTKLLGYEIAEGFSALGFSVRYIDPNEKDSLENALHEGFSPFVLISINFQGLDPYEKLSSLFMDLGTKVCVWFVDNPFLQLTSRKNMLWKNLYLFCTDESFIIPLKEHGAKFVHHLPLAASGVMLERDQTLTVKLPENIENSLCFVGRTAFPEKDTFFISTKLNDNFSTETRDMLAAGDKKDFFYWNKLFSASESELWRNADLRKIALHAEETGLLWRTLCLEQTLKNDIPLILVGDIAWKSILRKQPAFTFIEHIDYYTTLPHYYAHAKAQLNCTSPLLPMGLTQRNFDVFAAGGMLITDESKGLDIFPKELTKSITYSCPSDITRLWENIKNQNLDSFKTHWREYIKENHTYKKRMQDLLNFIS